MEEWRDVPIEPFGEAYQVSNFGRVRSKSRRHPINGGEIGGKILAQHKRDGGYYCISLTWKGQQIHHAKVHRIVAIAFCPNPANYPLVRHLDGDKLNNVPDNLIWGTYKENAQDTIRHGNNTNQKLIAADIQEMAKLYLDGYAVGQLAELYDVTRHTITRAFCGKSWEWVKDPHLDTVRELYANGNVRGKVPKNDRDKIRNMLNSGSYYQKDVAKIFGIHQCTVSVIKREVESSRNSSMKITQGNLF